MLAIDLPRARRVAFGVVLAQAGVTVVVALCAFAMAGQRAALSALVGGGIGTAGSLAMAVFAFGGGTSGRRIVMRFYLGEAVKLALVVVLFAVVLKVMSVAPLAMFAAFAATFAVYWIVLVSGLRAPGSDEAGSLKGWNG